jgi:hypothetical protein
MKHPTPPKAYSSRLFHIQNFGPIIFLVVAIFQYAPDEAQATPPQALWVTADQELSSVIVGGEIYLFEGNSLEAAGTVKEENGHLKAHFPDEGDFVGFVNEETFTLKQEEENPILFTWIAGRNIELENEFSGKWFIPENDQLKVLIDENDILIMDKQSGHVQSLEFALYGSFWVGLPNTSGLNDTHLATFTHENGKLVVTKDDQVMLSLTRHKEK